MNTIHQGRTSAAQDSVIRLALAMAAAYADSPLSAEQRTWIVRRLQDLSPFTWHERLQCKEPLLAYIKDHHPRILAIVEAQFIAKEPHLWPIEATASS